MSDVDESRPHLGQLNLEAEGHYKRVLFVCSGGMLRSATAAQWAATALDWNTRNCGTWSMALPPAHPNLLEWAQVVYCIPLGYPRGRFGPNQRKPLTEVCSYDHWGTIPPWR